MKERLEQVFNEMSVSELLSIHREYCHEVNAFDDEIYSMDEFDERLNGQDPSWIANRVFYGEFNPNDDYFKFNGYGNLESINQYNVTDYIYIDDIIDHIIRTEDSLYNDDVQAVLDEFETVANEED